MTSKGFNPKKVTPMRALTNTYSGVAGEIRIAAEFIRAGIPVAKPYWNDDEVDLLVFHMDGTKPVPIPIQVKTVQFLSNKSTPDKKTEHLQGLKKRYVERSFALCLAVYRPDTDDMWFVAGASAVKALYAEQYAAGRKQIKYEEINSEDDVSIALDKTPDSVFDSKYRIDKNDPRWLYQKVLGVVRQVQQANQLEAVYKSLFEPLGFESGANASTQTLPLAGVPIKQ